MIKKNFALPVIEQIPCPPVVNWMNWTSLWSIIPGKSLFALQGAHLLSWKPAGEEEVLWLSNNTPFKMASPFAVAYRFAGRGLVRLHNKVCLRTVLPATCRGR